MSKIKFCKKFIENYGFPVFFDYISFLSLRRLVNLQDKFTGYTYDFNTIVSGSRFLSVYIFLRIPLRFILNTFSSQFSNKMMYLIEENIIKITNIIKLITSGEKNYFSYGILCSDIRKRNKRLLNKRFFRSIHTFDLNTFLRCYKKTSIWDDVELETNFCNFKESYIQKPNRLHLAYLYTSLYERYYKIYDTLNIDNYENMRIMLHDDMEYEDALSIFEDFDSEYRYTLYKLLVKLNDSV